ncbi:DUF4391 domain-containing protein [Bifidobacterium simiarum]|uniref:DUF4391 domain-containing protein n=1 Tax=Bifidobacterium simiarum TaxID=2045441 RepID=A0A2M9HH78_9BIFI|nr:DUF4391 domain-containing protein [Bifidobacterium simiarum]PJM76174.1 hypothetical protein CSQ87_01245 [Bifidobacterium simiarum]
MTVAACGSMSMLTLGFAPNTAIAAEKSRFPKAAFVGKDPLSTKLRQRFVSDVESITLLGLLRPQNTGMAAGRLGEILVLGLRLNVPDVPKSVIERIAAQRKGGILFVCVRQTAQATADESQTEDATEGEEGTVREECALAIRRALPVKPGHLPEFRVHVGEWTDPADVHLALHGTTMDELWDSLGAQVILHDENGADLDMRLAVHDRIVRLEAEEVKLVRDHQRANTTSQRNEVYAQLHRVRTQIEKLRSVLRPTV